MGLGLAAGLADGRYAQIQSLSGDSGYLVAGLGLGGGLGLVLGAVSSAWVRWPSWRAAALLIGAALGAPAWLPPVGVTPVPPEPPPNVGFERLRGRLGFVPPRDLVVVFVPGLRDAVVAGDVPAWSERVAAGVVWGDPVASAPDPHTALKDALLFDHNSPDVPVSLADLVATQGRFSRVLLAGDRARDAAIVGGFGEVVSGTATPNGVWTWLGSLALPRALGVGRVPSTGSAVPSLLDGLHTLPSDRSWVVVAQLPLTQGPELGRDLRTLFDGVASKAPQADLLVVGLPTGGAAAGLDRAGVGTLAALWTKASLANLHVLPPTPLAAVVLTAMGGQSSREVGSALDAAFVPLEELAARRGDLGPERERGMAMAAAGQDTALACMMLYPDADGSAAVSRSEDGATVVRAGGYALWRRGAERRLYDEVLDAGWTQDLLAASAPTCGGVSAAARAEALAARGPSRRVEVGAPK